MEEGVQEREMEGKAPCGIENGPVSIERERGKEKEKSEKENALCQRQYI